MFFKKKDLTTIKKEKIFDNIDELDSIYINEVYSDIHILPNSNNEEIRLIYQENEIETYNITLESTNLKIKKNVKKSKISYQKANNLLLYLPSKIYNLNIDTVSSNIYIKLAEVANCKLDTVSGNIEINNIKINNINIDSVNGNIELKNITPENVTISTVSSNAILEINGKEKDFNFISEKILNNIFVDKKSNKNITLKTISGKMKLRFLK